MKIPDIVKTFDNFNLLISKACLIGNLQCEGSWARHLSLFRIQLFIISIDFVHMQSIREKRNTLPVMS